jgi:hypothetical protein
VTRALYVLGGAGAGKSTFMSELLDELLAGEDMGELEDLWSKRNAKALVTLRGHRLFAPDGTAPGLYLGCWRESFPGTDGLDRASSATGVDWLMSPDVELPEFIVAEGATLATRPFLGALAATTELLVVHLHAPDDVKRERFASRGSDQAESFWKGTATRAANRYAEACESGVSTLSVDTSDPVAWEVALDLSITHVIGRK